MPEDDAFAACVRRVRWYHEFEFGGGVRSNAEHPYRLLWSATEKFLATVDFAGKRVLDVGCWDGYWSFYAEWRGAASVLATDLNSQRWSSTAQGPGFTPATGPDGAEGFRLAHERFRSRVAYRGDLSVYDLASLGQRFDIVLFLGVLYHLTHPMYALTQIRHVVAPGGEAIIESAAIDDVRKSSLDFYFGGDGDELYRCVDLTNWSVPTRRCLRDMLATNYFHVENEDFLPPAEPAPRSLMARLLARAARRLRRERLGGRGYGRCLLRARAVEREEPNHPCEPLLGLAQYDPRFRKNG